MYKKTIFILLLFTILITSCRGKKEVSCPSFDIESVEKEEKKRSKYKVVILKDGKIINKKKGRRKTKNKLFKKKMY